MEEGIISDSKVKVQEVESDEEDGDFDRYDKSVGKPVHVDIDKKTTEENKSILALLPNRSEEDEINNNGETRDRAVILVYVVQTEYLNHRNDWLMYHISKPKLTFNVFTGPTQKEAPKPKLLTMEEVKSDQDPIEDDGDSENK